MSKNMHGKGVSPCRNLSQHFLISTKTIDRMLGLTTIAPHDHILEIGAGKGHITRRLLQKAADVTAVEIDPALYGGLRRKFAGEQGLRLMQGDFLTLPLPSGPYKVFANIPFSITTDILRKLTTARNQPSDCWLVVAKGAAKGFLGKPQESMQSLLLKPYYTARIAYYLRREDFRPMPSVETVLLHLQRRTQPDIPPAQRPALERFVRSMQPCLCGKGPGPLTKHQMTVALRRAGQDIPQSATLSYVQWLCLFRCWTHLGGASK